MKKQYDFSKAERGKFYFPQAKFHLPIYLRPKVEAELSAFAKKNKLDIQKLVNDWVERNLSLIQTLRHFKSK